MKGRRTSAAALACALVMGPAAAATADTWTHTDATGDVLTTPAGHRHGAIDASNTNTDITHVRIAHTRDAVVVTLRTASALPANRYDLQINYITPTTYFTAIRARIPDSAWPGPNYHGLVDDHFRRVRCEGLEFAIDRTAATIRTTVPRSCLGSPHWVRASVFLDTDDGGLGSTSHYDDGLRRGTGTKPLLSPKVLAPKGAKIA